MKRNIAALWLTGMLCLLSACDKVAEQPQPSTPEIAVTEAQTLAPTEEIPEETVTEPVTQPTEETVPEEPTEVILPPAQRINEGITIFLNSRYITKEMYDGNHYTKFEIHNVHTLRVVSEQPFYSVYIEWDNVPGAYSLVWDGGSLECGTYGFLHEYVRLPEAVSEVTFVFEGDAVRKVCNLEVFAEGSVPEGVQDWLPPADGRADVLVFPTHSDDDVLFFGPLISYYAIERQLTVQTAFMVEHRGYWDRGHERLDGLWEMGIRHYPILGTAPDTGRYELDFGMRYYASSDIPGWQTEQIRRFKPLVVVGHDLEGEYGNAGHKVNAYYLTQTVPEAADPEKYPESAEKYGVWDTPKLYLHLYPENEWYFDVNTPMEKDPECRTPFAVAEDAFRHHVSQNRGSLKVQQNDRNRQYDCRPFGLYRSLVGQDSLADIMENINPDEWR